MSCCAPGAELALAMADPHTANEEVLLASRIVGDDVRQTDLSVPGIHCGGCIQKVEAALGALPGVEKARVNLSTRRVAIRWQADKPPAPFIETLNNIGYDAYLHDAAADETDETLRDLIRALAVAGFAASNIMLLSVSVWSGADASIRNVFHWISAADRLPCTDLFGPRILSLGLARVTSRPDQHGRADLDRRAARLRHEPLRDVPSRSARLFRRRNLAVVLPADRPHARSHDARSAHELPSEAWPAWPRAARSWCRTTAHTPICRWTRSSRACTSCWRRASACRSMPASKQDDRRSTARWCPARACRSRLRRARCCPRARST